MTASPRIVWLGHSTVLIDLGRARLLTDPLLRSRVVHLRREGPPPAPPRRIDAVLLSHLHHDHADLASLRRLGSIPRLICPVGAGSFLTGAGFEGVEELPVGSSSTVGGLRVEAVPAEHSGSRLLGPVAEAIGFVVRGERNVYFAGDTDLFDEMTSPGPIDLAFLPVAGYGPGLGPGHLDPERAARAAARIRPTVAVPIHWGTLHPRWAGRGDWFTRPPLAFAAHVAKIAPEVTVSVLTPGEAMDF